MELGMGPSQAHLTVSTTEKEVPSPGSIDRGQE